MSLAEASDAALVVDASVGLKWVVEEEGSEAALALKGHDLAAPSLLRVEAANVLRTLAARRAITPAVALGLLGLLQEAPMALVEPDDALERRALEIAFELAHPIYDCVHPALAERMGHRMVTADGRLLRAVRATEHAARVVALEVGAA